MSFALGPLNAPKFHTDRRSPGKRGRCRARIGSNRREKPARPNPAPGPLLSFTNEPAAGMINASQLRVRMAITHGRSHLRESERDSGGNGNRRRLGPHQSVHPLLSDRYCVRSIHALLSGFSASLRRGT
jgi:hypothetical protein